MQSAPVVGADAAQAMHMVGWGYKCTPALVPITAVRLHSQGVCDDHGVISIANLHAGQSMSASRHTRLSSHPGSVL